MDLKSYLNDKVLVLTNDGRILLGTLIAFDQTLNIVLQDSIERQFSETAGVEEIKLGLYIVRGDSISFIGGLDKEVDASTEWGNIRAKSISISL